MEMVVNRSKQELRQKLLAELLSLTRDEIKRRSKNVERQLSALPIYKQAKVIMAYYPLKGEVDIREIIRKDFVRKRFCFPVMDLKATNLRIFEAKKLDEDFIPGPFGVKEPDPEKAEAVDVEVIDLIIVPGLAFDRQKNRLGRGAGFYDRFLSSVPSSTPKIGLAFEFQVLESLPVHLPLDRKVNTIVSENFII